VRVLEDRPAAEAHLRNSLARHEAMGARPLTARTRVELARLLIDDDEASSEVTKQLTLAQVTASELGMNRLLTQISELA
jgi:hypothetical protein